MTRLRFALMAVFAGALALATTSAGVPLTFPPAEANDPAPLTVHEWGTFTSIAGEDGQAVQWYPLTGPGDLPCFVERLRIGIKPSLAGTVRMETPVLYFYATQNTRVDVTVGFRKGFVTEWFPRASVTPSTVSTVDIRRPDLESRIVWTDVLVSPQSEAKFPTNEGDSHYYAARATSAAPLSVGAQREKFLFYRGVGNFAPPLAAIAGGDGTVDISNPAGDSIGHVILFERRGARIGYRLGYASGSRLTLREPELETRAVAALRRELLQILTAEGLYPDEAAAMLETWRDSWFEEGVRLFYVASRRVVDSILPLEIRPVPADIARVFVGRLELVTPHILQEVRTAVLSGDRAAFRKYGRFMEPIASRLLAASDPSERSLLKGRLDAAYAAFYAWAAAGIVCH